MKNKKKLTEIRKEDLWKPLDEHDVMQLRSKLNNIRIQTENELQSFNMNSADDAGNKW